MEQVHDTSRAPDRIRQDVSRSPGGDARVFLNGCIGCHSGMDPMAQAFAYYNFQYDKATDPTADAGFLKYNDTNDIDATTGTRVVRKYFNNNTTFPYGYITMNDHWDNYWRNGQNAVLGWDSGLPGSGDGAKSLGQELAGSQAFAQCQVEKVFTNVCLRAPQDANDRNQVSSMVSGFQSDYNLRKVFAESAVYCMGELSGELTMNIIKTIFFCSAPRACDLPGDLDVARCRMRQRQRRIHRAESAVTTPPTVSNYTGPGATNRGRTALQNSTSGTTSFRTTVAVRATTRAKRLASFAMTTSTSRTTQRIPSSISPTRRTREWF